MNMRYVLSLQAMHTQQSTKPGTGVSTISVALICKVHSTISFFLCVLRSQT